MTNERLALPFEGFCVFDDQIDIFVPVTSPAFFDHFHGHFDLSHSDNRRFCNPSPQRGRSCSLSTGSDQNCDMDSKKNCESVFVSAHCGADRVGFLVSNLHLRKVEPHRQKHNDYPSVLGLKPTVSPRGARLQRRDRTLSVRVSLAIVDLPLCSRKHFNDQVTRRHYPPADCCPPV